MLVYSAFKHATGSADMELIDLNSDTRNYIYGPTPFCKTIDHWCKRKSLLSYIRPVYGGFLPPGPDGYLRSPSSSSIRPHDCPCNCQVL